MTLNPKVMNQQTYPLKLDQILSQVTRPGRYLGNEINAARRRWEDYSFRMATIFPDLYEIGMSHLGLHILYHVVNQTDWALCDRAYCPDLDLEGLMRTEKILLWGLESRRPLKDFDLLAITLPYELCYSNILTILELAGIPLTAKERLDGTLYPVILGGGSCALNPEPVAQIFDGIIVGDAEEAILEVCETVRDWKAQNGTREELWHRLTEISGAYVPTLYRDKYDSNGRFARLEPLSSDVPERVRRRVLSDLDSAPFPEKPLVPNIQIVHDRIGLEIARGCTRGCRFCQAGVIYRPVRERRPDTVLSLIEKALKATGWDEISLLSLSTGDYLCLEPLLKILMDTYLEKHVAISLPSLRVGTLTPEIMAQIQRVRKTGFTLAPEAGTDRLREVINKGITEEDLLEGAKEAYTHGWSNIKLYFMIGLPTETKEDVLGIAELARKVWVQGRGLSRSTKVTVSVGTFVPKPHTAFQWDRQIRPEETRDKLGLIRSKLGKKAFQLRWHDPRQSYLEGIFSRGDRRVFQVLLRAWQKGARLDAWGDHLKAHLYKQAAKELDIDLDTYLDEIPTGGPLPWDHIDSGVKKQYLLKERERAKERIYTPDCRRGNCKACGVCDLKKIKPVTFSPEDRGGCLKTEKMAQSSKAQLPSSGDETGFNFFLRYEKLGEIRFLGHLDTVNLITRAFRRAGLMPCYSKGFHPKPKFTFSQPIPLGTESLCEGLSVVLERDYEPDTIVELLNREFPYGIRIIEARPRPCISRTTKAKGGEADKISSYLVCAWVDKNDALNALARLKDPSWRYITRTRTTRKGTKEVTIDLEQALLKCHYLPVEQILQMVPDAKRWIKILEKDRNVLPQGLFYLEISREKGKALRPQEAIASLLAFDPKGANLLRILKIESRYHIKT